MLGVARRAHHDTCDFVQADAVDFLRSRRGGSADIITCCWGLGYARPWRLVREAARVLRSGGRLGVIDNSLFSLAGVMWASILAFAERPNALQHVMRVRFLPGPRSLAWLMRATGLGVRDHWRGSQTYHVASGAEAIARLQATGAAAGFEHAAYPSDRESIFERFGAILERGASRDGGIPITHRYLAAIGSKP
jgi:SAM-dependent methyltransferase